MFSRIPVCLIAAVCLTAVAAQSSPSANAAPVSYVFVSTAPTQSGTGPNDISTLAVSSSGAFTHVGTATSPTTVYHMSVTKKFLFGVDNASNIYSYSISSTGALKQVATTHAGSYVPGFVAGLSSTAMQVDGTGSSLYLLVPAGQSEWYMASFKIESSGALQFLGTSYADPNAINQIRFVENNQYAVTDGCYNTEPGASFTTDSNDINDIVTWKRESNGFLTYVGTSNDTPAAKSPYEYCALQNGSDSASNLAVVFNVFNPPGDDYVAPPFGLGVYTVNSSGDVSTTSDYENMATTSLNAPLLSIDPTGKLLAAASEVNGFQLFHFNGANPITNYTGILGSNNTYRAVSWDKSSHLFLLTSHSVDVYNATSTSYSELKPWEFTNPYAMIVLSE